MHQSQCMEDLQLQIQTWHTSMDMTLLPSIAMTLTHGNGIGYHTPYTHFTLVVVQHLLTIVAGQLSPGEATDFFLSLTAEGRDVGNLM